MGILDHKMAADIYSATTGFNLSVEEITRATQRVIHIERCFNAREGLRRDSDTLPTRFLNETLSKGATTGHVDR